MSKENIGTPLYSPEELHDIFFKKIERIKSLTKKERVLIEHAYRSSEQAHQGQFRAGGEAYFEHPRAVALILMEECGTKDWELIITALLHDTVEDTPLYANREKQNYFDWKESAQITLPRTYNRTIAKMVLTLSKPFTATESRENQLKLYYTWLNDAIRERPKTILVKMADRLHNLRTLESMPKEKRKRKIQETKEIYIPLFEKFLKVTTERGPEIDAHIQDLRDRVQTVAHQIEKNNDLITYQREIKKMKTELTTLTKQRADNAQLISAGTYLLKEIKRIVL